MQIGARHLRALGYEATLFSNHLHEMAEWFFGFRFAPQPRFDKIEELLEPFDAIFLQHDNTPKARKIRSTLKEVYTFYGSHQISKHGPLRPKFDFLADRSIPMAENIARCCQLLFPGVEASLDNGLAAPPGYSPRKYPRRIAIHPTSASPLKNWLKPRFLKLRRELEKQGYEPVFIASKEEAEEWGAPEFKTLSDLASFLYESGYFIGNDSGPGHLASNLNIPSLIIGQSQEHLAFWKPGWAPCRTVHPKGWIPQMRAARKYWKSFITVDQVIKEFTKLTTN
jgi:ADP-heptose:LPS heptosyltransferase